MKATNDNCPKCKSNNTSPMFEGHYDFGFYYDDFKCNDCGCEYNVEFKVSSKVLIKDIIKENKNIIICKIKK